MARKKKCYSVRLKEFVQISDLAYRAVDFQNTKATIPASQYFGIDSETTKSKGFWLTEWILKKRTLQYSNKKVAWFDENGNKYSSAEKLEKTKKKKFIVKYKKDCDNILYSHEVKAESKELAETETMQQFYSAKLEIKPISENGMNKIEIESITEI